MRHTLICLMILPFSIAWVLGGLVFAGMALERISVGLAFAWIPAWIGLTAYLLGRVLPQIFDEAIEGDLRDAREATRAKEDADLARWRSEMPSHRRLEEDLRVNEARVELRLAEMRLGLQNRS